MTYFLQSSNKTLVNLLFVLITQLYKVGKGKWAARRGEEEEKNFHDFNFQII